LDASTDTSKLVAARELAARRDETRFTTNDILFQVRHDPGRLARLRNHMRWKQIRTKAKVKDDDAAGDLDLDEVDDLVDDDEPDDSEATRLSDSDSDPSTPQVKKANVLSTSVPEGHLTPLPWSILSMFPHASDIPSLASFDDDEEASTNGKESPLLGSTTNPYLLARLQKNDERTRGMTAEEYTVWSECRSASFTFRKKQTFREWCGLGIIADHQAKEDVLEILGLLTSEWVQTLTEKASAVKEQEIKNARCEIARVKAGVKRKLEGEGPFVMRADGVEREREEREERETREAMAKIPIQPQHVRQAFELLQTPPKKYTAIYNGTQLRQRKRLRIF
jgi:transcription initiation protein SPT3